jgi:hypothetical protein
MRALVGREDTRGISREPAVHVPSMYVSFLVGVHQVDVALSGVVVKVHIIENDSVV